MPPRVSFLALSVSARRFRVVWCLALLAHVACAAFFAAAAALYVALDHPLLLYYADLVSPRDERHFLIVAVILALLGLAHVERARRIVLASIAMRRLVFCRQAKEQVATDTSPSVGLASGDTAKTCVDGSEGAVGVQRRLWRWVHGGHGVLFHPHTGLFGLESRYFERLFLLREFVEVITQTYQVYRSSVLIATPWINHAYVAMIVINCWSTPCLQHFLRKRPALERVLCLCVDFCLGCGATMLLPLAVVGPYVIAFDQTLLSFDQRDLYDDVWFVNFVMGCQQMLGGGMFDLAARVVAYSSIFGCLLSIEALVRPPAYFKRDAVRNRLCRRNLVSPRDENTVDSTNEAMENHRLTPMLSMRLSEALDTQKSVSNQLSTRGYKTAFTLWGAIVLALHVHAHHGIGTSSSVICHQKSQPWFTRRVACSVVEFNCWRLGNNTGSVPEFALDDLEEASVRIVILSHCETLRVPSVIRRFRSLIGFEIFNASIVAWTTASTFHNYIHRDLRYVFLISVNIQRLPSALTHDQLPPSLTDVEISHSNLSELPIGIDLIWRKLSILYVENSFVETVPVGVFKLGTTDLSLAGNHIRVLLEESLQVEAGYLVFSFASNPLEAMPSCGRGKIRLLDLEWTNLTELPSWISSYVQSDIPRVRLQSTPFCQRAKRSLLPVAESPACLQSLESGSSSGQFPWVLMQTRRLI